MVSTIPTMNADKYIVVDVQGFKTFKNEFIFKEIAICKEDGCINVYMLKPPCPWNDLLPRYKSENSWLIRNYHGIDWNVGDYDYGILMDIADMLASLRAKVYVKGLEKKLWLEKMLSNHESVEVINMENLNCPSINKLKEKQAICSYHTELRGKQTNCAAENVLLLHDWLVKNKTKCI